jgi:hypothetical protein
MKDKYDYIALDVIWVMKYYGTNTQGPKYKLAQQARRIAELVRQMDEVDMREFDLLHAVPSIDYKNEQKVLDLLEEKE